MARSKALYCDDTLTLFSLPPPLPSSAPFVPLCSPSPSTIPSSHHSVLSLTFPSLTTSALVLPRFPPPPVRHSSELCWNSSVFGTRVRRSASATAGAESALCDTLAVLCSDSCWSGVTRGCRHRSRTPASSTPLPHFLHTLALGCWSVRWRPQRRMFLCVPMTTAVARQHIAEVLTFIHVTTASITVRYTLTLHAVLHAVPLHAHSPLLDHLGRRHAHRHSLLTLHTRPQCHPSAALHGDGDRVDQVRTLSSASRHVQCCCAEWCTARMSCCAVSLSPPVVSTANGRCTVPIALAVNAYFATLHCDSGIAASQSLVCHPPPARAC